MRALISALSLLLGTVAAAGVSTVAAPPPAAALPDGQALTPPMGFNNWNATGCAINETLIRDTADLFVSTGLKDAGYKYVNIDDCWAELDRDPVTGRYVPHHERFPSGIEALADYVHARGLKLGIYTSAGTQTCARTMPGSLGHEDIDAQTFAEWGVDYLKYDNCHNQNVPALERYPRMRDALKKTGRPIVYSICEWGQNRPWEWGADVGHLWRTTGDINDSWASMLSLFKSNVVLAPFAGPGHWNDPDMLEVGNGGMTEREYRSHFSLWASMAAPLLIGTDLRRATPQTLEILGNRDVIAVDQDPLGAQATVLRNDNGRWILKKPLANGDIAVTLFNETESSATIGTSAAELGLPQGPAYVLRDLWEHRTFESAGTFATTVPAHGTVMYRVSRGADWWRQPPASGFGVDLPSAGFGVPGSVVPAGKPFTASLSVANHGRLPMLEARFQFTAPDGWAVRRLDPNGRRLVRAGETVSTRYEVIPPAATPVGPYQLAATVTYHSIFDDEVHRSWSEELIVPEPVPAGVSELSAVHWAKAANGFGPVELDMSNGGIRPGDGRPLTINGRGYAKGLGTHAEASILYYLAGRCSSLSVDVGIDDERDPRPDPTQSTAIFEIWADGVKVADSGLRTWQDDAVHLDGNLTGASFLRIVTNGGPDGFRWDRGDWADPVLTCTI
ncbi:MAG TPA: NPCBM/NEW2 domain-containing protein [Actinophytocola sp.]|uniref:NPCBM/NEW2 domain-containing protein n=1 Tax=Actinophytocola sp. TaxID=1872138 RepID=UPI002DDCDEFD|nr:NPCBM/NEW2 domain-containing protein [Actinophytocola sp.]HEV2781598.1 NPCBM/NEW2 domain-containing protein [Actinophytocola sp.]